MFPSNDEQLSSGKIKAAENISPEFERIDVDLSNFEAQAAVEDDCVVAKYVLMQCTDVNTGLCRDSDCRCLGGGCQLLGRR
jgi:hypothetical protein